MIVHRFRRRLRRSITDTEELRTAYEALMEEYRLMEAQSTSAQHEADRLGIINAEIIGNSNPAQRIRHIDNLRRVLCETKQVTFIQ